MQRLVSKDVDLDLETNDDGVGSMKDNGRDGKTKEKKASHYLMKNGRSILGSYDNFVFFARVLILQYRLPLFCFVILLLVF